MRFFESYEAKKTDIELKVGYMRKLNLQKFQLYAGLDAVLSYALINESGTYIGGSGLDNKDSYPAYGMNLGVGIRYYLNKNWSIALEKRVLLLKE